MHTHPSKVIVSYSQKFYNALSVLLFLHVPHVVWIFSSIFKMDFAVGLNLVLFCYIIGIEIESELLHSLVSTIL